MLFWFSIQWSLGDLFDVTLFTVCLLGSDELWVYDQIYVFIHESYLSFFDLLYAYLLSLLQDAANATLRSETLRRNCVRCHNRKRWCKKPSKKVQNVCDGGCIKHGSDFSCVCDVGHTIQFYELFAMMWNKRNGQPNEGVWDIHHTVHSDELFVIRQHKRNGQPDQGVCDIRHAVHSDELFALRQENRNGST